MTWDPTRYLAFSGHRLRPALDLLQRIPLIAPRDIVDLGCGPGNVTALLRERWPHARLTGIDSSEAMLAHARRDHPEIEWRLDDIATWQASPPPPLIFTNAVLHWLPQHHALLPRLLGQLAPEGVFAAQMPSNYQAPSHTLLREIAAQARWSARCSAVWEGETLSQESYYEILAPLCNTLDIWETEYLQVLRGPDPVLEWTKATSVLPFREAVGEEEWPMFEAAYCSALRAAYPQRSDGTTLFPFKRLFIVASL